MCNYCNGFGCIHCLPESEAVICPECDGHGKIYFLWDEDKEEDIRVPYEEYKKKEGSLDADAHTCPVCNGDGWIAV